jgi:hypothetical protein
MPTPDRRRRQRAAHERTREVVERFRGVRYVCEPTVGLNVARNRAMHEASTDSSHSPTTTPYPRRRADALIANFGDPRVLCATGLRCRSNSENRTPGALRGPLTLSDAAFAVESSTDSTTIRWKWGVGAGANMALRA